MKPTPQVIQQRVQQARADIVRGVLDEAKNVAQTASEQITGAPPHGQEQSQSVDDTEAYRQKIAKDTDNRMAQLKSIIEQEMRQATVAREQKAQEIAKLQTEQMWAEEHDREEKQKKGGFVAGLGRAAKRIKGRIGQVGKGKMEKGRGGGG